MKKTLIGMFVVVALIGCGSEQTETIAEKAAPAEKAAEQTSQNVTEAAKAVTEKAEEVKQQVVEKAEEVTQQVVAKTEEVKAGAEKVVQQASDKVAAVTGAVTGTMNTGSMDAGKAVYDSSCKTCHSNGLMGAPKLGDDKLKGDREALVKNAINGIGRMPAKGGVASLSDEKVRSAVEYMIEQSK